MRKFDFYLYQKVEMYAKHTFEVEADSMEEAKRTFKEAVNNGDEWEFSIDYEYLYETTNDVIESYQYDDESHNDITEYVTGVNQ